MPFTTGEDGLLRMNEKDFDFNVQFEQLFFSIIPSVLFIISSTWRTLSQSRKPTVVNAPFFQLIKLGAIIIYVGLELTLLILVAIGSFHVTSIFLVSSVLKLLAALFMITLSIVDHSRSPRPSVLLSIYLFLTLLLDAAQARTLFLLSDDRPETTYSSIFAASVGLKAGILLLEAKPKSKWISWDEKEHSPEESSSIFSLGVLFWLNNLFLQGYRKTLVLRDLYPLDVSLQSKPLHDKFSKHMDYAKLKGDKFGLLKVLVKTLIVPILLPIPPRLALLGFTFCQPFFIEKLLEHLNQPDVAANVGYGFIGASIIIYAGMAISAALCWYLHHRMRAMTRAILVTETFIRATEARIGADDHNAALTLMSTDIERIRLGLRMMHNVWAGIIQAALAAWMLYIRLGTVFVAPIGVVIVCFTLLGILVNFTGDSQRSWMAGVQKRVGLTATVIASMKNLKISGLSSPVSEFVQKLRVEELLAGARFRKIFIVAAMLGFIPMLISPPLALAFTRETLDATRVFTSLSFLTLLTNPLSQIFQSIPELVSGLTCIGRIQAFLECETRHDFRRVLADQKRNTIEVEPKPKDPNEHTVVNIQNGKFGWEADKFVLQNVNTQITKSSLTIVIGQVGSGKSTLCKALLGEIPFSEGTVTLSNRFPHVGFCDQIAFLWNGTIRDNITGFSRFDDKRYSEVIRVTALDVDFTKLPQGDRTNVGSDGIVLSGGQKQRVSLARALYLQSDLLILDDIFSGLDANTEQQVFRQVFGPGGLLRQRRSTVVLCTHSVRYLPASDHVIVLGDGGIIDQGDFTSLVARQDYVQRLGLSDSSDSDDVTKETTTTTSTTSTMSSEPELPGTTAANSVIHAEDTDQERRLGDRTVFIHYFKSMGLFVAACCFFLAALWGFFTNFPTVWLTFWTDDLSSGHPIHSHAYYVGIYALLEVCGLISLLLLGIVLFIVAVKRAGANLHHDALRTLIRAPLHFFTNTDTGVVTNLFSQDLNLIDTELPDALLNTLFCVSQAVGQAAVMLTSSAYLAISYPFLAAILYAVQRFYLRTSRQLRLLDLEAKSPLYTHFLDTLRGVATLRAFGESTHVRRSWTYTRTTFTITPYMISLVSYLSSLLKYTKGFIPEDISKNAGLLDTSQQPAYLLAMVQEWLNLVLDLVVMVIAAVLTTLAVRLHSSSGFTGASLVTLMGFGENLSGIVIYYTRLETSIGAISRIKAFNETVEPEDRKDEDILPPESWPQHGAVELTGVSASYHVDSRDDGEPTLALRDVHLTIQPGEKIAICGRTGSGKSSLVSLLLKLLDPLPGTAETAVVVNDLPLQRLNRSALRQHIIAVPQEAVFLPDGSTFQANLDPSGVSTSEECEAVLSAVGLWDFVQERGGLNVGMMAGTLSAGQRQLMSLGRAVLRRRIRAQKNPRPEGSDDKPGIEGGILLLDEVNSSVDHDMERVMKDIIKTEFQAYTVIAVSHRLDMIMDFDRVVVMDTGEIVEVGNPLVLSGMAGTRFGSLVKAGAK